MIVATYRDHEHDLPRERVELAAAAFLVDDALNRWDAGDYDAVWWMASGRFVDCCAVLDVDPEALREEVLGVEWPDPARVLLRDREAMRALYAAGATDRSLARRLGLHPEIVNRARKRHGIPASDAPRRINRTRTIKRSPAARQAA